MPENLPKIVFYDVDHKLEPSSRSWSPFTARTRLALLHRKLPFTRKAVSYPDIAGLLSSHGVPEAETKSSIKYTLPAISLLYANGTEEWHMDSKKIAPLLESLVPSSAAHPSLFPDGEASHKLLQDVGKAIGEGGEKIYAYVIPWIPFILDDRAVEYFNRTREEVFNMPLDQARLQHSDEKLSESLKAGLECIARVYVEHASKGKDASAPFIGGKEEPQYADLTVAAVVEWWRCARGDEVLQPLLEEVQGGILARVMERLTPQLRDPLDS